MIQIFAVGVQIVAFAILTATTVLVLTRLKSSKREYYILFLFAGIIYVLGEIFSISATSVDGAFLSLMFMFLGGILSGPLFLTFILNYLGYNLPKAVKPLVFTVAFLLIAFIWASPWHDLFYEYIYLYPDCTGPTISHYGVIRGVLYPLATTHITIYMIVTIAILLIEAFRPDSIHMKKLVILLLCAAIPGLTHILYFLHLDIQGLYLSMFFTPLGSILIYFGILKYDLLENERERKILEQIRASEERADDAAEESRTKSRFLARMSHEIRTPITAVLGISEMQLRNQTMPPHTEEAFSKIYVSSKMLLHIVNDILDFSRIESGKMPIINKEYDVASLVSDTSSLHLAYSEQKDVLLKLHVDANLPAKLIGDALRIRQIISNLLSNAFKYTESGNVVFSLQGEKIASGRATIAISVQDTGIGMSAEQMAKIEDEYARFHEQENSYVSGTGLGLSIVYSLSELMGARFDLRSEVGKGTHAVVRIPQEVSGTEIIGDELAARLQNFEVGEWSVAEELKFKPTQLPHGKVLVIDDMETNLYVIEAMLEAFGLTIELCTNGEDAVEKIRGGNVYDVIFMDYMMPGMDGIEATKIMRKMGYDKPIVALTANVLKGQAEMFMQNGFCGFISKPIDIKILNSYLMRFIGERN